MKIDYPLIKSDLMLRTLCEDDISTRYLSWLANPKITRFTEIRFAGPIDKEKLTRYISMLNNDSNNLMLGIFLKADESHIGNIKLGPIDFNHSTADIGLLIGECNEWGKGYATNAIQLLSEFAFSELGLAKLTAGCYCENLGSKNAFLSAGFFLEGRRHSHYSLDGIRQDGILLAKLNPLFLEKKFFK